MKTAILILISAAIASANVAVHQLSADEIVARMTERDQARRASLGSYTWTSQYVLDNKERHAEMTVRWTRQSDGTKRFEIVSEKGDGCVRDHVFHKLLESEVEASQPSLQERNRLNTKNYLFQFQGMEPINGHLAYVLEIQPKNEAKYLTKGRIWVNAEDYAVVQMEGSPSKKPSFWINSVSFVQTFEKTGDFWLASSNRSVTETKVFGKAEMTIKHFDYSLPTLQAALRSEQ
jgi:outer membrane lipoprotein-sorting protein